MTYLLVFALMILSYRRNRLAVNSFIIPMRCFSLLSLKRQTPLLFPPPHTHTKGRGGEERRGEERREEKRRERLTHYHTIPYFDTQKIYSCEKHCEKRRNCFFSQCFLPCMALIFHLKCTLKCRLQFFSVWTSLVMG